jgi:hypothetical protein
MKNLILIAILISTGAGATAWEVTPADRGLAIQTETLRLTVRDGMVTAIRDRRDGVQYGHGRTAELPAGLGILRDVNLLRRGHIAWGDPAMKQALPPDFPLVNYFRPCDQSKFSVEQSAESAAAVWRGLSNGREFLPDAEFRMAFSRDAGGAIGCKVSGSYPGGGVFAALIPLAGLNPMDRVIVPGFGGIAYDAAGEPALMPFGGAPFMEAPLLIAEGKGKSLGLWMEDPTMRVFFAFVRRDGDGLAVAMEVLTLMPFETRREVETPTFKLNVFKGDWKRAATPFRDYYRKQFAGELAARDAVRWAGGIRNIIDTYMQAPDDRTLAQIAALFPKESVMFQNWNARAPQFDRELPDWTPRAGYVDGVKRIHQYGFKTMAYVNTYCVNYLSPVWKRDQLENIVLTRKNSLSKYLGKSDSESNEISEKLIGTVDYSDGANPLANIEPGRLIYTDPLSLKWRVYHARQMVEWNTATGTDANYEDTAGTATDSGNGVVDGISAGQGAVEQMRLLQKTQPQVPMSSEYGPAAIAFATSWALNYASAWGNEAFRRYRISRQYPVTAYLYGYRQWVTSLRGTDPLNSHAMAATSDATGGLGFCSVNFFQNRTGEQIRNDYGWQGHFFRRSLVFAEKELTPYFPETDYPSNIRCLYRGKDGVYSYRDDGALQQMLGPDRKPLYGRVFGADRVETALWLADWPLQGGGKIFGLDPTRHYPLFPRPENAAPTAVTLDAIPDGIVLSQYRSGNGYAYLEFTALPGGPKEVTLTLALANNANFSHFFANDEKMTADRVHGTLPLRVVCLADGNHAPGLSRLPAKGFRGRRLYRHNEGTLDFVFHITEKDQAFELFFRNEQDKYPHHGYDGSIVRVLINGNEISSYDCLPEPGKTAPDTRMRRWTIPTGTYAGKPILLSVVTDCKKQPVQDLQFVSAPAPTRSADQKLREDIVPEQATVKAVTAAPENWNGAVEADGGARVFNNAGTRSSRETFTIDPGKVYRLSGRFKMTDGSDPGRVFFGLAPLDGKKLPIQPIQVNPLPGTETELAADAAAGTSEITIKDPANWKNGKFLGVAFGAQSSLGDLPNRDTVSLERIEGNRITLSKPLPQAWAAGTPVRQHQSGNTYIYLASPEVTAGQWVEVAGEISGEALSGLTPGQWWRGSRHARIIMVTTRPGVMFKDIRLEEIE